jgi:CheY-like chemotaxis protein
MSFHGREGSLTEGDVWTQKTGARTAGTTRVLICHIDANIGESIVLLLGLKGYEARRASTIQAVPAVADQWNPQVVFFDTRICTFGPDDQASRIIGLPDSTHRLLIALSTASVDETAQKLRGRGFDGYLLRPSPIWQLADILNNFYSAG